MGSSDIATYFSMLLGTGILISYTFKVTKKLKSLPDIGSALSILLPGIAIPQGLHVCYLAFESKVTSCMGISPTFLFIGGITIVWVSIDKITSIFKEVDNQIPKGP